MKNYENYLNFNEKQIKFWNEKFFIKKNNKLGQKDN